jgi:membrane protease YdiL (CAAX protease family)
MQINIRTKNDVMIENHKKTNWKYTLLRVLAFCFCCALILILVSPLTRNLPKPWPEFLLGTIATILVFGLTIVFARWEKIELKDIGIIPNCQTLRKFIVGFSIGLLLVLLQVLLVLTASHSKLIIVPGLPIRPVLIMFSLYFILALREELAFRGFPLRSLNYAIGPWKSQLIIALIFSLEHLAGGYTLFQAFLGAGIGAILFGIAALQSKGIALPVGIHLAWNFGQWCAGFKNEPGIWQNIIEKGFEEKHGQISFAFYILVMSLAIVAFYFYYKKENSTAHNTH